MATALAGGPTVARVLVINADSRMATLSGNHTSRPHGRWSGARFGGRSPDAAFVGGTQFYFTELNRTHPQHREWDGICYSMSPQIHAFTDIDVVENLDAQAETARERACPRGREAVVISPITLRRRGQLPRLPATRPPDTPGELPDSVDVRQSALLGAAWTAGSIKYLAEAGCRRP